MTTLAPQDVAEGMTVCLAADRTQRGVVLKRSGQRVRVDLTSSGGRVQWVTASDLLRTAAATAAPATATVQRLRSMSQAEAAQTRAMEAEALRHDAEAEAVRAATPQPMMTLIPGIDS
jgi:hypothetical protein